MLVRAALDLARMTGGRFDPTVGALRRAWDFKDGRVPSAEEIARILPLVDADAVSVRDRTVFLRKPGMEIDLGGVGKEYAVDRAARLLRREGIRSAIVNFAGDVRTVGSRGDGHPWKVGVIDPRDRATLPVRRSRARRRRHRHVRRLRARFRSRTACATTTSWTRGPDGPFAAFRRSPIVAASAFRAGRFATAAFLLGAEAGLALLEDAPGVEGTLITDAGALLTTTGMSLLSDLPGSLWAALQAF